MGGEIQSWSTFWDLKTLKILQCSFIFLESEEPVILVTVIGFNPIYLFFKKIT
jgi:hypothetical protein